MENSSGRFPRAGGTYIFSMGVLRREDRVFVWMDELAGDGAGADGGIRTGSRGICSLHFSLVAGANKNRGARRRFGHLCAVNMVSTRMSAGLFALDNVAEICCARDTVFWAIAFRLGAWSNFVPFVAQRRGLCPWRRRLALRLCRRSFRLADGGTQRKSRGKSATPTKTLSARIDARSSVSNHRLYSPERSVLVSDSFRQSHIGWSGCRNGRRSALRRMGRNRRVRRLLSCAF